MIGVIKSYMSKTKTATQGEVSQAIITQITDLLRKVGTEVIFDTRTDSIAISNKSIETMIVINCDTSTIAMSYNDVVMTDIHNSITIEAVKEMCQTFNHNEFNKRFQALNVIKLNKVNSYGDTLKEIENISDNEVALI